MLKQTLATRLSFFFTGLLLSVMGDESYLTNDFENDGLPFFVSSVMEKCFEESIPLSCHDWNGIRHLGIQPESPNAVNTKQTNELSSKKDTSKDNYQEEISIETPFTNSNSQLNKRFTMSRRKTPVARGYKRGPGFRSWGGKRDPLQYWQNTDKKNKFASWGGKRNEQLSSMMSGFRDADAPDKRPKFQNWGGKKSTNDYLEEMGEIEQKSPMPFTHNEKKGLIWKNQGYFLSEPFKKHVPKRPQFQSWGGKRTFYPWHQFIDFSYPKSMILLNGDEKRKFSSWGGKRFDEYENQYEDVRSEDNVKRHVFQNWGGKKRTRDSMNTFTIKESDWNEKTKELDKKKVMANWEKDDLHSNFDYDNDKPREGTNQR